MKDEVDRLLADEEVTKGGKKGIYEYLLSRDDDPFAARLLQLRTFEERDKRAKYAAQGGICPICHKHFDYSEMAGDHIKPWSKGGLTVPENLQMLCRNCNSKKSDMF
ncbi:MAG: HNH endonuclease [Clostridia bacterium]|nr:HNH endonuclease [Clostridia bacterium]